MTYYQWIGLGIAVCLIVWGALELGFGGGDPLKRSDTGTNG